MEKIMFNDECSLTQAVLDKRKNNTRRIIKLKAGEYVRVVALVNGSFMFYVAKDGGPTAYVDGNVEMPNFVRILKPKYSIGQEVAVAQSYGTMANEGGDILANMLQDETTFKPEYCGAGWKNKMFVRAELMPHRIKITNIRVERLQDISEEDCLKEGVVEDLKGVQYSYPTSVGYCSQYPFSTPKSAYAALIDKVSGKGTWESNPWVFVYEFELLK